MDGNSKGHAEEIIELTDKERVLALCPTARVISTKYYGNDDRYAIQYKRDEKYNYVSYCYSLSEESAWSESLKILYSDFVGVLSR